MKRGGNQGRHQLLCVATHSAINVSLMTLQSELSKDLYAPRRYRISCTPWGEDNEN